VKLGLNVRNFGPSAAPDALLGWARFAEDAGFALAMMSDHVAPTPDVEAIYPAPFYDPFTTLSWLAAQTSTVRFGTSVTVLPYRHPLQTARIAASIDRLSGGRFVLGVGVGWSRPEFAALGVPFDRRGQITDEYLDVIRSFWTTDLASRDGEFVAFREVSTGPRPAGSAHPPIWVGGAAPAAIRRTVRYGDAWHPINMGLGWLRGTGLPALREAAAAIGRPVPALCPRIQLRLSAGSIPEPDRPAGTGSLDQIRQDLDELADLGAEYLVLDTNPDDPHDRRALSEDFRILETVARHWRSVAT
jgi:probable F420-dependent oxidoreductase